MFGELPWIPFNRDELAVAICRPPHAHHGFGKELQELMSAAMTNKIAPVL